MMAFGLGAESVHIRDPRRLGEWLCRVNLCNQALASSGSQLDPFNTTESATTTVIDRFEHSCHDVGLHHAGLPDGAVLDAAGLHR